MTANVLNTFSKEEAEKIQSYGLYSIKKVCNIKLLTVNSIIKNHFKKCPQLISLDVEGLDYEILQSFDFHLYRPIVFCIETLEYREDGCSRKLTEIIDFMMKKEYMVYADTYLNTIFVEKNYWNKVRNS